MGQWTPLHESIRRNNAPALQILIDGGLANLEIKDIEGESPVFVAATNTSSSCLGPLLAAGANPSPVADDAFSAVRSGLCEQSKFLLMAGADLSTGSDMFGRGTLQFAEFCSTGNVVFI